MIDVDKAIIKQKMILKQLLMYKALKGMFPDEKE